MTANLRIRSTNIDLRVRTSVVPARRKRAGVFNYEEDEGGGTEKGEESFTSDVVNYSFWKRRL